MEDLFKVWTGYLASEVEGVAGLLIAIAALQATHTRLHDFPLLRRRWQ